MTFRSSNVCRLRRKYKVNRLKAREGALGYKVNRLKAREGALGYKVNRLKAREGALGCHVSMTCMFFPLRIAQLTMVHHTNQGFRRIRQSVAQRAGRTQKS